MRLAAGEFTRIERIEAANQMPHRQFARWLGRQEIGRVFLAETNLRIIGGRNEIGQVSVHILCVVRVVYGHVVQCSVGVVQGDIECGTTHKRSEKRKMRRWLSPCVELGREWVQHIVLERITNFERMPPILELPPSFGDLLAERHQRLMSFGIRQRAGPRPLNTQRCFAPTDCRSPSSINNSHANSRHVTVVSVSLPNLSGTRVVTGRKNNSTRLTRTSVALRACCVRELPVSPSVAIDNLLAIGMRGRRKCPEPTIQSAIIALPRSLCSSWS